MPKLKPNTPVTRSNPVMAIGSDFEPGRYVFRLQVHDDAGNLSKPVQITVTVTKPGRRVRPRQIETPIRRDATVRVNPRRVDPRRFTIRRPQ